MRFVSVCLLILAVGLMGAVEGKGKDQLKDWPEDPYSKNGEMPRPAETEGAWAGQSAEAAQDAAPVIAAWYMWRGRADRDYKPFHQWEVQLRGGREAVSDLRFRVVVLGPDMKPLLGDQGVGHWAKIGRLGAGDEVDFSYKFNCSAPTAARVECRWDGGEASYLAPDPKSLPVREGDPASEAKLLVLQPDFAYDPKRHKAKIAFFLRNDGGKPATGVVHTVKLVDHKGKVVQEVEHVPTKDGTVPAGYAERVEFVLEKVPKFDNIQVSTKSAQSEGGGLVMEGGEFTGVADLEVAHVKVTDGTLTAAVRNGLPDAVRGLSVRLDLLDGSGGLLEAVELPVGDLQPEERKTLTAEVGDIGQVLGWNVGFSFGAGDQASAGGAAAKPDVGSLAPMDIDGVQLKITDIESVGEAVKLDIAITNTRDAALSGLRCELQVQDAAGTSITIPLEVGDLAPGASFQGAVVGEGISDVAGVQMGWSTGG